MCNLQDLTYIDSIDRELELIEKTNNCKFGLAKPFEIEELLHIFEEEEDEEL